TWDFSRLLVERARLIRCVITRSTASAGVSCGTGNTAFNNSRTLAVDSAGKRGQALDFQLACQGGIPRVHLPPSQLGLGDEPQRGRRESQVMLPGSILLGLEFVPADLRLRILKGALGEVAAATPRD